MTIYNIYQYLIIINCYRWWLFWLIYDNLINICNDIRIIIHDNLWRSKSYITIRIYKLCQSMISATGIENRCEWLPLILWECMIIGWAMRIYDNSQCSFFPRIHDNIVVIYGCLPDVLLIRCHFCSCIMIRNSPEIGWSVGPSGPSTMTWRWGS